MYRRYIKRILDVVLSMIGIIIAFPFLIIISFLLTIKLGRPILFKQERVSKDGKAFWMIKFRTMSDKRDENGELLTNEERLTKLGKILRSSSLDELPELLNILKGDISFIGPRPLIPEYMPLYTKEELTRFHVKGGLIPPEVLYGNITPTWEEQFDYEIDYGRRVSFLLDLKILLATAKGMFKRNSIEYGSYVRPSFIEERRSKESKEEEDIKVDDDSKGQEVNMVGEEILVQEEINDGIKN